MRIEFSRIAGTVHDYLMWSYSCDSEGWIEFSKGKCTQVPFNEALWIYNEEVSYWLNAN